NLCRVGLSRNIVGVHGGSTYHGAWFAPEEFPFYTCYQVVFFFGDDGVSHGDCFPDDFHPAPNPPPLFLFLFSVCPAWLGSEGGKEGRKIRTRGGEICSWMGLAVPPYLL
ncbi:unnamed protein product, partial [Laminaria digitata]